LAGTEFTELVHEPTLKQSLKALKKGHKGREQEKAEAYCVWDRAKLNDALENLVDRKEDRIEKEEIAGADGGSYSRYFLVIPTDEFFLDAESVKEWLTGTDLPSQPHHGCSTSVCHTILLTLTAQSLFSNFRQTISRRRSKPAGDLIHWAMISGWHMSSSALKAPSKASSIAVSASGSISPTLRTSGLTSIVPQWQRLVPFRRGQAKSRWQTFRILPILNNHWYGTNGRRCLRPVALPREFEERFMQKTRAYNAAAAISMTDYAGRALGLRRGTAERMTATQVAVAHSQALMANIDTLVAELAGELTRKGWLWPAYRSGPSEPEMEAAQWLDRPQEAVAQFRDSAQETFVRAEKMRDPNARQMMLELAMHYESLALRVENVIVQSSSASDSKQ
jgi:hypothetical protein